ncbi:MAG TPA: hypothetical protein VGP73_21060 [Thermoanaerobaculia bacterium]
MRKLVFAVFLLLIPSLGGAQVKCRSSLTQIPLLPSKDDSCSGGIIYDDGSFEDGYGFNEFLASGSIAQAVDLPAGKSSLDGVCICWSQFPDSLSDPLDLLLTTTIGVWKDDGPGGAPGTLLTSFPAAFVNVPVASTFYHVQVPSGLKINGPARVFVGPTWSPLLETSNFFVCADQNGPRQGAAYSRGDAGAWQPYGTPTTFPAYKALGIRVETSPVVDPVPPSGPWLTVPDLAGYQFKVRINGAAAGTEVADCVPETLCVAGAIPTRAELFLRIIGPRPNGFLWAEVVRFSISHLEVWVQRTATSETRYYDLPAVANDATVLPGLVDTQAFQP